MTRSRVLLLAALVLAVLVSAVSPSAAMARQAPTAGGSQSQSSAAVPAKNDYAQPESWLCRPERQDACVTNLATTLVAASGRMTREDWKADPNAPIDCFYVYPTVSMDPTPNSDMVPGPEERRVVEQQFARFGAACRLYAPMYRQVTATALLAAVSGKMVPINRVLAYEDVVDAWRYYLEHDNRGRGVVLIGHSQGAQILLQLVRSEIDGKPAQGRLVSAMLIGTAVGVPKGGDVGGALAHLPLCHSASQTGCVITYASFRANVPPPSNSLFGRVVAPDRVAGCTNPAALGGGRGELRAYFPARSGASGVTPASRPWVKPGTPFDTPFVGLPGLLTAECASKDGVSYLAVTVHGYPEDPRVDDIPGDLIQNGQVQAGWGLHLVDMNLAMGNLVDLVRRQAQAWTASRAGL